MARNTFQYKETISLNRLNFLEYVVRNVSLNKKSLRVCLHLLCHLDGINYREVSKRQIASDLNMSKSDVSKSFDSLIYNEIIERGSSSSVKDGYKLLF